ncbi:uncharacterized protein EI90DRAFT_3029602 [Cantharellus anzutake]|uniref:uncharacterized protein n=1 Tax=Cantharellus anzutake TaxID=1750568 RepID=UPI0019084941|nr:uncharacterized protein EI90DRAFT_3029602 [Cantharellus anzutake]KAF8342614.1 hypothetical protein EI90DRAFT_3029602 [Cantharellus anzutake]
MNAGITSEIGRQRILVIDDGTHVVECIQTLDKPKQVSLHKGKPNSSIAAPSKGDTKSEPASSTVVSLNHPSPLLPIGALARVIGTVKIWHEERHINLQKIEHLKDLNEEYKHWKLVEKWHREIATVGVECLPPMPVTPSCEGRRRPQPNCTNLEGDGLASCASSGGDDVFAPSDELLHPSLIRSRDLTLKTFEIYLMYFMTHDKFTTPSNAEDPFTPQNKRIKPPDPNRTPTQSKLTTSLPVLEQKGFTINYLRNAPDLRYLARRVVLAETRRRDRESRKREKLRETQSIAPNPPHDQHSSRTTASKSQSSTPSKSLSSASLTSRMKKLFETAIRSLYQAGEIIVLPRSGVQSTSPIPQSRPTTLDAGLPYPACLGLFRVWDDLDPDRSMRADDSYTTIRSTISKSSKTSKARISVHDESVAVIDEDPPPNHTGLDEYLPVTPELLAEPVLQAVKKTAIRSPSNPDNGTSVDRIASFLKKNELWARVGEWTVQETLKLLSTREQVWEYAQERWKPMTN